MSLIYLASSGFFARWMSADGTVQVFGLFNYMVRKSAHFGEFAILTYLWFRSIWTRPERLNERIVWAVGLSILYAITDEFHQSLVPERQGIWTDILFDAPGALVAGWVLKLVGEMRQSRVKRLVLGSLGSQDVVDDKI
jgi:VanZ family protein